MHAAINLDHQHGFLNRKIRNVGTDRVLPPDRISERPQLTERLPRDIFRHVSVLTEFSGTVNDGSLGHG